MNSVQRSLALARVCARQYSSAAGSPSTKFHSLKTKQAKFQINDGVPVFLKGGVTDKIMFQVTIVLMLLGSGMMGKLFWDLAVPKKD